MRLGQRFVKYFVCFLGNGVSRKMAVEIYWPLLNLAFRLKYVQKYWTSSKDLDLSKIVLDIQKSRVWVPYLQNPVYGPITLVLSSEIKECTHGNLHFEHDELLAFYRRFFPPFFKVSNYELFLQTFKVQKVWVQIRVSVPGVKSLGAILHVYAGGFYEVKKKLLLFFKRKWKYFYTFNHFYSEKSSKRAK